MNEIVSQEAAVLPAVETDDGVVLASGPGGISPDRANPSAPRGTSPAVCGQSSIVLQGSSSNTETSRQTIEILNGRCTIHTGDVLARLAAMPADSVDCVVTSPPYWGLRDYGVDGQIGLERTLGDHLDKMVQVFEAIRRVLKPAGTLWLNYGDCYATQPNGRSAAEGKAAGTDDRTFRDKPFSTVGPVYGAKPGSQEPAKGSGRGSGGNAHAGAVYSPNHSTPRGSFTAGDRQSRREEGGRVVAGGTLKPKDLCLIPQRLVIALQDAGWWIRADITWAKPNAMPDSSGHGRPSVAHEQVYLLVKDADAGGWWRARDTKELSDEPDLSETTVITTKDGDKEVNRWRRLGHFYNAGAVRQDTTAATKKRLSQDITKQKGSTRANGGSRKNRPMKAVGNAPARTRAVPPRHEGQRNHEHLSDVPRGEGRLLRTVEPAPPAIWTMATSSFRDAHFATFPPELVERCIEAGCPPRGIVLDPFGGAGTTAVVAIAKGRTCHLIELNPEYVQLAARRIDAAWQGDVASTATHLKLNRAGGAQAA